MMVTRGSVERHLLMGGIGLLSIVIALLGGAEYVDIAGLAYILLLPVLTIHGFARGRAVRALSPQEAAGVNEATGAEP